MTEWPTQRRRIAVSHTTNAMTIGADVKRQNSNPFLDLEALAGEESAEEDKQVSYSLAAVVCFALMDNFHWQMNPKSTIKEMQTGLEDMLACTMCTKNKTWMRQKSGITFTWDFLWDHKIRKGGVENMATILATSSVTILAVFLAMILMIFSGNLGAWYVIFHLPKWTSIWIVLARMWRSCSVQNSAGNKQGLCAYSPSYPRMCFCGSCLWNCVTLRRNNPRASTMGVPGSASRFEATKYQDGSFYQDGSPSHQGSNIVSTPNANWKNGILKNGDHVKILGGDYRDVIGIVKDVCEHEYVVHLPSQDLDKTFQWQLVQATFCPGDEMKVLDGPHTGLTGWVVNVHKDGISLMNMQKNLEVQEHISHSCTIWRWARLMFWTSKSLSITLTSFWRHYNHKHPRDPNLVLKTPTPFTLARESSLSEFLTIGKVTKGVSRTLILLAMLGLSSMLVNGTYNESQLTNLHSCV